MGLEPVDILYGDLDGDLEPTTLLRETLAKQQARMRHYSKEQIQSQVGFTEHGYFENRNGYSGSENWAVRSSVLPATWLLNEQTQTAKEITEPITYAEMIVNKALEEDLAEYGPCYCEITSPNQQMQHSKAEILETWHREPRQFHNKTTLVSMLQVVAIEDISGKTGEWFHVSTGWFAQTDVLFYMKDQSELLGVIGIK